MNPHLQRGLVLFEQSRFEQAEPEFRQAIASDSQDAYSHSMLALTLAEQERFKEAEEEVGEALKLDPGQPFIHYVRARILFDRERLPEAEAAIAQSIQLDPEDADYRGLQAQIFIARKRWDDALAAAERGLALDPEHILCTNLRAIALVQLGRKAEAGATIDRALARNPEDSVTHANQGWTLLHAGDHQKALEHFRESLRLDPQNEWARQGTIEALKAKNIVYAFLLKYFLWMSRLSDKAQWLVILGAFFGMRILRSAEKSNPALEPFITPIQILYLLFVFLTWTANPLFNLLLRLNKFGRMVLNREEIVASNWVGTFVALALLSLVLAFLVSPFFLVTALVFGFSVLPLAGIFQCQRGWPRFAMTAYTILVFGTGLGAAIMMLTGGLAAATAETTRGAGAALLAVFVIGILGSGWIANILMMQRVRK